MKKCLFFFSFLLLIGFDSNADGWQQLSAFPGSGREFPFSFAIGSKGYVGCGRATGSVCLNDFWEFDANSNSWTQKSNFPGKPRFGAFWFVIRDKGYIGTGVGNAIYNDFWEYNPGTNTWTRKADFSGVPRSRASGFSIGNKGYIGTGRTATAVLNDFWEWDQATDTWTKKTDLPGTARADAVGLAISGKGYIATGGNLNYSGKLGDIWEYDPASDAWTRKADLPGAPRRDAVAFSICDKAYIGTGGELPFSGDFWQFDPVLNLWTKKTDVPGTMRDDCAFFIIGNKGYLGLGQFLGTSYALDFLEYIPDSPCTSLILPIADFQSSDTAFCENDCINFTDLSIDGTSWQWDFPGAIPSSSTVRNPQSICYPHSGNYNVTLVASNAGGNDTLRIRNFITVFPTPLIPYITQEGEVLYCADNPSYVSYQWFDSTIIIPKATNDFLVITHTGNYNVQVTNIYGCKIAAGIHSNIVLNTQTMKAAENLISISPNPVVNELYIDHYPENPGNKFTLAIFNLCFEKVQQKDIILNGHTSLNVQHLSSGIYFVRVSDENKTWVGKFLKE